MKHLIILLTLISTPLLAKTKYKFADMAKKCGPKDTQSCFRAAKLAPKGEDMKWYKKGCDLNHESSCISIGNKLFNEKKPKEAFTYYNKFCAKKSAKSCFVIGSMFYATKNIEKSFKYYQLSCDLNFAQACRNLAVIKQSRGDRVAALGHFQRACYLGDKVACKNLGIIYKQTGEIKKSKEFFNLAKLKK